MQFSPRECVVMTGDSGSDGGKIKQMLERSNVVVTDRKRGT